MFVQPFLCRRRSNYAGSKVVASDSRGFSVRVEDDFVLLGLLLCVLWWLSAAMHRRVYSVYLASKPSDAALAVEVSGPASPGAVGALNDAVSIFDF